MPRSGESTSIPKFRPRFWIPQIDDKIPGLDVIEYAEDIMTRGHTHMMMKTLPFTSPAPMLKEYWPPITHEDAK